MAAIFRGQKSKRLGLLLASSAFVFLFPQLAVAQQAASTPSASAEVIIVTGQKIKRSSQTTQESITIFGAAALETKAATTVYELISRVPNVQSSFGENGFNIRGIESRGVTTSQSGSSSPTLSVFSDEIAYSSSVLSQNAPFTLWDIDQIAVYRGPQSTVQGRNSLAGAILIKTKDPNYTFGGAGRVAFGNYGRQDISGVINGPIVADQLAVRLSVDSRKTDGFVDNEFQGSPARPTDDFTLRAKALYEPSGLPGLSILGTFVSAKSERSGYDTVLLSDGFRRVRNVNADEDQINEFNQGVLRVKYKFNDMFNLTVVGSVIEGDYALTNGDFDSTPAPLGVLSQIADYNEKVIEGRLNFERGRVKAVVGLFYGDFITNIETNIVFNGAILGLSPTIVATRLQQSNEETSNSAIFGEVDFKITSQLRLTLGGRYDLERFSKDFTQSASFNPPTLPASAFTESGKVKGDAFLPKVAVNYEWTPDFASGFTVQKAYRAGSFGFSGFSGTPWETTPETTLTYEADFRLRSADRRLSFNTNIFYTDWKEQQVETLLPGAISDFDTVRTNAGKSRLHGVETELTYKINDAFNVYASAGYLDTEFITFDAGYGDLGGNEFPLASKWSGVVGVDWRSANGFSASADVRYRSSFFGGEDNDSGEEIEPSTLVGAKIGYTADKWSIKAFSENLFDVEYFTNKLVFVNPATARLGAPRTIAIELTANF